MKPTLGRIVHYQTDARAGLSYPLPAIVSCTRDSHAGDYPDGTPNPLPVPDSDDHVHLTVFTPGPQGVYSELNVPLDDTDAPEPRTWHWPPRA